MIFQGIDKLIPGVAAMVDDVVIGFEDAVAKLQKQIHIFRPRTRRCHPEL
jgi:hypothetical protein